MNHHFHITLADQVGQPQTLEVYHNTASVPEMVNNADKQPRQFCLIFFVGVFCFVLFD